MRIQRLQIGGKQVMPFTIPSGIITTQIPCLEKLANEVPEVGILTTKSIGPKPRQGNREPILAQYKPQGFINAVGLTNPGSEEFAKELRQSSFPRDKFLLASIFGGDSAEFVLVAKTLEDCVDGFELNLSCPHAKGYGMQLGQDPKIVGEITREVVTNTNKPVFAKLTPNAGNIGEIAQAAAQAGAAGIVAINTVGPGYHSCDGRPVLTNKLGGLSGRGITPIGLKCVRDIRQAVQLPIIGMGGIATARDVEAYASAGANVFGIGSALAGMNDEKIKNYFAALVEDLHTGTSRASLQQVNMDYQKVTVGQILNAHCDFRIFETSTEMQAKPGQFVFAWIPGVGEKPFSVMNDDPLTLGVQERGGFTREFAKLKQGDSFYIRGPYGQGVEVDDDSPVVLVGGGCGIAGIYLLAKRLPDPTIILAAKDRDHIPCIQDFERFGQVRIATEDGSLGKKGLVTEVMDDLPTGSYFFNCGPQAMVSAVLPKEMGVSPPEKIYSSLDYLTRCGVGICGSCADKKGRRSCIEGPFQNA